MYLLDANKKALLGQDISSDMNPAFDQKQKALIWTGQVQGKVQLWSLVFGSEKTVSDLQNLFAQMIYESNTQTPFSKVDENWVRSGYHNEADMEDDDGLTG